MIRRRRREPQDRFQGYFMDTFASPKADAFDRRDAERFSGYMRDMARAKLGGPNSAASMFSPSNWGSAASRDMPGLFGTGAAFGAEQARARGTADSMAQQDDDRMEPASGIRRRRGSGGFGYSF